MTVPQPKASPPTPSPSPSPQALVNYFADDNSGDTIHNEDTTIPYVTHRPSHSPPARVSANAHKLIKFFASSIHIQGAIHPQTNKQLAEQWIELTVRYFLYDTTNAEFSATHNELIKLKSKLETFMQNAFQSKKQLREPTIPTTTSFQSDIETAWVLFYKTRTREKRNRRKKNTCAYLLGHDGKKKK